MPYDMMQAAGLWTKQQIKSKPVSTSIDIFRPKEHLRDFVRFHEPPYIPSSDVLDVNWICRMRHRLAR